MLDFDCHGMNNNQIHVVKQRTNILKSTSNNQSFNCH